MSKKNPTFRDVLREAASHSHRLSEIVRSFARIAACAVAHGTREDEYHAEIKHCSPEQLELFRQAFALLVDEMQKKPYEDLLGMFYCEEAQGKGSRDYGGEFYTPAALSKMIALMTLKGVEIPEDRPLECMEPSSGAGGMILAAAAAMKDKGIPPCHARWTCIDVSRQACDMCFLNLTLWGIPAQIVHGNALSLEVWGTWRNLFWYEARGLKKGPAPSGPIEEHAREALKVVKKRWSPDGGLQPIEVAS